MPNTQTLVFSKTVMVTNSQILSGVGTPISIIEAPGIGKAIMFISASLINNFTYGNYGNIVSHYFEMIYENGDTVSTSLSVGYFNGIIGFGALVHSSEDEVLSLSNIENKALQLAVNGSGELDGGNEANTIVVNCCYTIIDI